MSKNTKKPKSSAKRKKKEPKGPGGPRITKGKSEGEYGTPRIFLQAVEKKFGPLVHDLAADHKNKACESYFSKETDALKQDWRALGTGNLWLNPPFSWIEPWAKKCKLEGDRGANIFLLVPASVGSKWHREHVHLKATIYYLYGRLTFVGETTPYPKDCMLVHFHQSDSGIYVPPAVWDWRKEIAAEEDKAA